MSCASSRWGRPPNPRPSRFFHLALVSALALAAGCGNPVHDEAVAVLGGEGPASLYFATAGTVFQDAMNVFPNAIPMAGATVTFTDACAFAFPNPSANDPSTPQFAIDCPNTDPTTLVRGVVSQVETNCAGNFYVLHDDWVAAGVVYPMHMSVNWGSVGSTMLSHMAKETSCATCHVWAVPATNGMPAMAGNAGQDGTGQIYLNAAPLTPPPPACP